MESVPNACEFWGVKAFINKGKFRIRHMSGKRRMKGNERSSVEGEKRRYFELPGWDRLNSEKETLDRVHFAGANLFRILGAESFSLIHKCGKKLLASRSNKERKKNAGLITSQPSEVGKRVLTRVLQEGGIAGF